MTSSQKTKTVTGACGAVVTRSDDRNLTDSTAEGTMEFHEFYKDFQQDFELMLHGKKYYI